MKKYNKTITQIARNLRKNMTKEENKLWYCFLRRYPVRFRRQQPFGNYVADFYCSDAKLVIELDGSQHYEDVFMKKDIRRTAELEKFGVDVIRIPNNQIMRNFDGVCEFLDNEVKSRMNEKRTTLRATPQSR